MSLRESISFRGLWEGLRSYSFAAFRADLLAGFNVALLAIPQAMAYALVANLPVAAGLVTAIVAVIVAALFGSSRHLIFGPTNAMALIAGMGVSEVLYVNFRYLEAADVVGVTVQLTILLTLMVGIIQIIAGLCRLGQLTQLISHSVVVGYMVGLVLAVYASQSFDFLGLQPTARTTTLVGRVLWVAEHITQVHVPTLLLGTGCVGLLLFQRWLLPRWSPTLVMLAGSALAVYFLGLGEYGVTVVGDTGHVALSTWTRPPMIFSFELANDLLPTAFAISLLSMIDAAAVGKTLAARTGQRLNSSQELVGLGVSNLCAAFMGGMPSSASPSRSIANYVSGARTRLAAVFSGLVVAAILFMAGDVVERIPVAALAALILVMVVDLVDKRQLRLCWRATRSDRFVLLATILACVVLSLATAFYIGIALSMILFLRQVAVPKIHLQDVRYRQAWREGMFQNVSELHERIQVVRLDGELFFGAADLFQDTLKSLADENRRVIVLMLSRAHNLDATACLAIRQLHSYLRSNGCHLLLAGVGESAWGVLERSGLVEKLGSENLFPLRDRPTRSLDYAVDRAVTILEGEGIAERMESSLSDHDIVTQQAGESFHAYLNAPGHTS